MGTIVRYRNVNIIINTNDHNPPHVHVLCGDAKAKIEIETRKVIEFIHFGRNDMRRILEFIESQEELLMEAWNEIHKKS